MFQVRAYGVSCFYVELAISSSHPRRALGHAAFDVGAYRARLIHGTTKKSHVSFNWSSFRGEARLNKKSWPFPLGLFWLQPFRLSSCSCLPRPCPRVRPKRALLPSPFPRRYACRYVCSPVQSFSASPFFLSCVLYLVLSRVCCLSPSPRTSPTKARRPLVPSSVFARPAKVFMRQRGLDKPFTGGLGSFKLYALIAAHLQACGCGRWAPVSVDATWRLSRTQPTLGAVP